VADRFNTKIAVSDVDKLEQLLDQTPVHRDAAMSKRQAIVRLAPKLRAMQAKGYSWAAVALWLSEHGLAVSKSVLQGYLRSSSLAAAGASVRAHAGRRKTMVKDSAGTSSTSAPANQPGVAAQPEQRETPAPKPAAKDAVGRRIEQTARRSEFAVRPDSEEL
jgi:hypothetical protein